MVQGYFPLQYSLEQCIFIIYKNKLIEGSSEKENIQINILKWRHDTQHNDTQHNDNQHNDTQNSGLISIIDTA